MSSGYFPELTITRDTKTGVMTIEWEGELLQPGEGIYVPGDCGTTFWGVNQEYLIESYAVTDA